VSQGTAHTLHWACAGASTVVDRALILLVVQNKPTNYENAYKKSHLYLNNLKNMSQQVAKLPDCWIMLDWYFAKLLSHILQLCLLQLL
jgi:hypothetical protein